MQNMYPKKKKTILVFRAIGTGFFYATVAFSIVTNRTGDLKRNEIRPEVFPELVIVSGVHFRRFRRHDNETRTNTK